MLAEPRALAATALEASAAPAVPAAPVLIPDIAKMQLVPQIQEVWCACAAAQMVLSYHGISVAQSDVAVAMRTTTIGTTPAEQVAAYAALSKGAYSATLEDSPTFDGGNGEIGKARPYKSGIVGHARAVAGWKIDPADRSQWIYVYDPWPPADKTTGVGGAIYWENWTALSAQGTYVNDIFVDPPG
jgi:hypothetical protein